MVHSNVVRVWDLYHRPRLRQGLLAVLRAVSPVVLKVADCLQVDPPQVGRHHVDRPQVGHHLDHRLALDREL